MSYAIIQPPFIGSLREMDTKELQSYRDWFIGIMPNRVSVLENAVNSDPGFESWSANHKPSSLEMLGEWFVLQVRTRPRTSTEQKHITNGLTFPLPIPDWELTDMTLSLAVDIGMYFGLVLRTSHPNLHWEQFLTNKKFADYGQIVLSGFGKVPLNPVRVMTSFAYGIARGKGSGKELAKLYFVWERMIPLQ